MDPLVFAILLFGAAALYSAVGHGGASAYLALMALTGFAPEEMRPLALVLNLFVSAIAFIQFRRTGAFNLRLFLMFAIAAIPMAYLGGGVALNGDWYRRLLGMILLGSAAALVFRPQVADADPVAPSAAATLPVGGALGLVAGLTGTGGGIFLSPLLIFMRWAEARTVAGISAAFIFCNSAAGLFGQGASLSALPTSTSLFVGAVVAGGLIGSGLSATRLPRVALIRLLALVLLIAGGKLLGT
ncbi:MAG: sulfite exporter TauE/SafE family protein [Novosphingobium sp.]|jgi:uncharacterized membrane protein YfcA|uniref:sulfite exporter TauE/SafE family protein n=1 Tax=Novosphingobium sp. TaxID=1874826 RepID=UPI001D596FFE|nr:sulfite exporter TauE/SafE family protein [Novosphingobium sp.]MCB2015129.1 sulfite exporter TauE/SafE family protein [Sphingobium sp.]MCP5386857.1 sulfite exporter TauE/SafE family protein [Novosphingobium sp.]